MEPIDKVIGDRMSFARRQRSLTQEQLAVEMGATQGSVRNWEKGRAMPPADAIARASQALGVSSDWLLGLTESQHGLPAGQVMVDRRLVDRLLSARTSKQVESLLDPDPDPVVYAIAIPEGAQLLARREADELVSRVSLHLTSHPEAIAAWRRKLRRS